MNNSHFTDKLFTMLSKYFSHILQVALPEQCIICAQSAYNGICHTCLQTFSSAENHCTHCGIAINNIQTTACGKCLKTPPPITETLCAFTYTSPVDHLLWQLKFYGKLAHGRTLGIALAKYVLKHMTQKPDLLLPIPLHRTRHQKRGFNQAIEIAKPLSKECKIPLGLHITQKIKHTPAQASLQHRDRQKNLKRAFEIKANIEGKHIALIDDIMTTSTTVNTLATELLTHGAKRVDAWCVARTQR